MVNVTTFQAPRAAKKTKTLGNASRITFMALLAFFWYAAQF